MADPDLVRFVKGQKGLTDAEARQKLESQGVDPIEAADAVATARAKNANPLTKPLIIVLVVVALLGAAGPYAYNLIKPMVLQPDEVEPSGPVPCGGDASCFYFHAHTCTPVTATLESTQSRNGTVLTARAESEVTGEEDEACTLVITYLAFTLTYQGEPVPNAIAGKTMTCRIPNDALPTLEEFTESPAMKTVCNGPLRSALDELLS